MIYERIQEGVFLSRPNRFIARVLLGGEEQTVHVKNTGRCAELLVPGVRVYVQEALSPARKTRYDLIAVIKKGRIINMDSAAPNAVFGEWLKKGGMGFQAENIRPERTHGDSRFDFYFEHDGVKCFAEVKGVTLEENNVVRFPDAPTVRGVKHLYGLAEAVREGYEAYAVFVVQLSGAEFMEPNRATHPQFAEAMEKARDAGVHLMAVECSVRENTLDITKEIPIKL